MPPPARNPGRTHRRRDVRSAGLMTARLRRRRPGRSTAPPSRRVAVWRHVRWLSRVPDRPNARSHGRHPPDRNAVNRPPITAIHPLIQSRITRQTHGRAAARQSGDPTCRHPAQDRPNWRSLWRRSFVPSSVVDPYIAGPAAIHAHARHVVENRRSSRNGSGVGGARVGRGRAYSALVRAWATASGVSGCRCVVSARS